MGYTENYNTDPGLAYEGMVSDVGLATIISRTTTAAVGFGKAVQLGAEQHKVTPVLTGATAIEGLTVRSQATPAESPNEYPANDTAGLLRKGEIWLTATGAVSAGDDVWLNLTNSAFSAADPGGSNGLKLDGCSWTTDAADGKLSRVRVNLDVGTTAGAA